MNKLHQVVTIKKQNNMKKNYQTPTLLVVKLQHKSLMQSGSPLGAVNSNADIEYVGSDEYYEGDVR